MIKLENPGERGGEILVRMTPFDLLSLQEGLVSANSHLTHVLEEHADEPDWALRDWVEAKLKDVRSNYKELEQVKTDRELVLR